MFVYFVCRCRDKIDLPFSKRVQHAASRMLRELNIEDKMFNTVHIRRGDRLSKNRECTSIATIIDIVAKHNEKPPFTEGAEGNDEGGPIWLFFLDAEDEYKVDLKTELDKTFSDVAGLTFLWEDDIKVEQEFQDNYFRFAVFSQIANVHSFMHFNQNFCYEKEKARREKEGN